MTRGRLPGEIERLRTSAEEMQAEVLTIAESVSVLHVRLNDLLDTLGYGRERPVEHAPVMSLVERRRQWNVQPKPAA